MICALAVALLLCLGCFPQVVASAVLIGFPTVALATVATDVVVAAAIVVTMFTATALASHYPTMFVGCSLHL